MLSIILSYLLYFTLLYSLIIIPKKIRSIYVDIISLLLLIYGNAEISTFILLKIFHKYTILLIKIHDINIIRIHDSIYYYTILYICYHYILNKSDINIILIIMSNIFLLFCLINILFSLLNNGDRYIYMIYKYSTIAQTISIGYFISTMLWYTNDYSTYGFIFNTLLWIYLISFTWYIYICSNNLLSISMNHAYINEILLTAIYIAFIKSILSI